ncbi:hypothetical protein ANHYDRO_00162 [Anaerococcus hydrogenalis DSM 7454]|uniref:Uncharacterized protein n=1 Tax=Anaerococcus hydrogenalis DSM 7454 TaxID=561177 RepID=B6W6I2_9FIRM|nr:hypothetical protein ANHYDRO_00162 [Anaerococcus hydrogenalis DSM 7454]
MSSKLLKAKSQDKNKKSILWQIERIKTDDKAKSNRKDITKVQIDKYRQSSDCLYSLLNLQYLLM